MLIMMTIMIMMPMLIMKSMLIVIPSLHQPLSIQLLEYQIRVEGGLIRYSRDIGLCPPCCPCARWAETNNPAVKTNSFLPPEAGKFMTAVNAMTPVS